MSILQFPNRSRVFTPLFLSRLSEANRAVRQLRDLGCCAVHVCIGDSGNNIEIVVNKNPRHALNGCPDVHVTVDWKH